MVTVLDALISRIQALDLAMAAIWLLAWLMFAFAAGGIAQGKGHGGGGYLLLGLLLSPVIGMIVAFCLTDKRSERLADLEARLAGVGGQGVVVEPPAAPVRPVAPPVDPKRARLASVVAWSAVTLMLAACLYMIYSGPYRP